ncbi:hybrid sensor histidine kinase/response regulator [Trichocoleus desertorum]|uniref:histidine kinase n=2 Tax=Trichocoleus TaxID=450526 RepID=A0ABV0JFH6_9CYAN|nr:GAF domain-containing protein [Trichocoleus sp. FACHB-46]
MQILGNSLEPYFHQEHARILIVEDNPIMRRLLCQTMRAEGYQVMEACDGEEGLAAYERFQPDLVLLDAVMPGMDGFACCRQLKDLPGSSHTSIMMITSLDDPESVNQAFAAGALDYVTKPIHWTLLRQRVERLLQAQRDTLELQSQMKRERVIGSIAQRIHQSLDLAEILNVAVAEIRQFLQTDRVMIYRFNSEGCGTVSVESVAPPWASVLGQCIRDSCFNDKYTDLYRLGRIRIIEDIHNANLTPCHVDFLTQFQVKANMVVPILQGEHLWGLLIAHHCQATRYWRMWEVELAERLAIQLAIAIKQSELYQQVQQLNTELTYQVQDHIVELQQALRFEATLKRITDKVRDSLDEDQILQTAVEELAIALDVGCCNAALYDYSHNTSHIRYEFTRFLAGCRGQVISMEYYPEIYQQLQQGQCFQFCAPSAHLPNTQTAIFACPMMNGAEAIGNLCLINSQHKVLSASEVRLVEQVANQCAIALRQARLYQAAQATVTELERLNQLKDDFLSTVSHELRSPISNMRLAIQMLERNVTQSQMLCGGQVNRNSSCSKSATYLQILRDECEREISLVNDLLDLQRLEAEYQPQQTDVIQLPEWVLGLVASFEERINDRQQTLILDLEPELPDLVTDAIGLKRILTELLHNACKYTPPEKSITVAAHRQTNKLYLSVTNTGVEISPEELPRIFDKFYRIPNGDPWKQGGTGLGLALVNKLVNHLGGSIQVMSAARQTCFTLELPL